MSDRGRLDIIDAALAELRESYPAYTWDAARGKDARGSCIHADEDSASPIDVQFMAPGRWLTIKGHREWRGKTALESFRRCVIGLPCDITTDAGTADQIRPAHYGGPEDPYECIKVIRAWGLNFELGNVAKYLSRAGKKPGVDAVDDLRKLVTYAQMEIERREVRL